MGGVVEKSEVGNWRRGKQDRKRAGEREESLFLGRAGIFSSMRS